MRVLVPVVALVFALACACACATSSAPSASPSGAAASPSLVSDASGPAATAVIEPRSDSTVSGTARFSSASDGLKAHVEVQGAKPGKHGVHIHEKGDCSDPKAASAGAHYNPNTSPHHGGPHTATRHGGDLGNIEVDANGKGTLDVVVQDVSVASPQNGVVGRSIIIHETVDDLATDPAGNSGARLGCGAIQAPPIG
jgi:Cu-Zn family superoxide dismutase